LTHSAFVLLQHLDDAVIVADECFRVVFWNDAASQLYGIASSDALGRPIDELITIERCPLSRDEIRQRLIEHGSWRARVLHRSCAGRSLWVDWTVSAFEANGMRGTIAVTKDVDLQRRAEEALRESAARFRTAFAQGPDPAVLIDSHVLECNSAACELVGCDPRELIGRSPLDFAPQHQPDGVLSQDRLRSVSETLRNGKTQRFAWRIHTPAGTPVQTQVAARIVLYDRRPVVVASLRRSAFETAVNAFVDCGQ